MYSQKLTLKVVLTHIHTYMSVLVPLKRVDNTVGENHRGKTFYLHSYLMNSFIFWINRKPAHNYNLYICNEKQNLSKSQDYFVDFFHIFPNQCNLCNSEIYSTGGLIYQGGPPLFMLCSFLIWELVNSFLFMQPSGLKDVVNEASHKLRFLPEPSSHPLSDTLHIPFIKVMTLTALLSRETIQISLHFFTTPANS